MKGKRDGALLSVGMAGALRRSELVGLDVEHLAFGERGVDITIRRSKTDQEGAGQTVGMTFPRAPLNGLVTASIGPDFAALKD